MGICATVVPGTRKRVIVRNRRGGYAILANTLLKEKERCDQRVMPNCGGVPSTPFFCSLRARLLITRWPFTNGRKSGLLRLPRLDPEPLVPALPAPSRPDRIPCVAVHADLLDEVPCLCLRESCHMPSLAPQTGWPYITLVYSSTTVLERVISASCPRRRNARAVPPTVSSQ